jgi:carbamoyl-phosphate synthase large subunit
MVGQSLIEQGFTSVEKTDYVAVKESVFPFAKFHGVDTLLSPEMKSTGEVMGLDANFGLAFAKAQIAAGNSLPKSGAVFISVTDRDKPAIIEIARSFQELGFDLLATGGTAKALRQAGIDCRSLAKVNEGTPNIVELIQNQGCAMLVNTPMGKAAMSDDALIRKAALMAQIPYTTTLSAAKAAIEGIRAEKSRTLEVRSLQEHYAMAKA